MFLNEFTTGTTVNLKVSVKGHTIKLNTDILEPIKKKSRKYGYGIVCNPVIVNDRLINFKNFPVMVDIFDKSTNRVCRFRASAVALDARHKKLFIFSQNPSKVVENRCAHRVPCIFKVIIKFEDHTKVMQGRTHDISYNGASFVLDKEECDCKVGDKFTASIFDEEEHVYKTEGKVVRIIEDFNPDLVFLGVRFAKDKLRGLVSRLQMKETRLRKE